MTVVIPNWNGLVHLPECVASLRAQTFSDFETVVVDNASADDSVTWLREHAPEVRVIERGDNGGFAVAVNEGIRASSSELIALLNNDTAVDEDWLSELVAALDRSGYDAAASLMVLYDHPGIVNAAGDDYWFSAVSGRNRGLGQPVDRFLEPCRVLGACAGAALYRRDFFATVGLFDEAFFLIHEDTNLNLRGLISGTRCIYVPTAVVRHKHSATIKSQPSRRMLGYETRNRAIVMAKDLPLRLLWAAWVLWPWRLFRSTFPLRPENWGAIPELVSTLGMRIRAEFEGYRMGLGKRDDVWRRQAVPTREIIRWLLNGTGPLEPSGGVRQGEPA